MESRGRRRLSFTNRLLMLAALIVVATTVLLALTSIAGVYDLALEQQRTREAAYRDILIANVGGRLDGAYRVVRATAQRSVMATGTPQAVRSALMTTAVDNAQYLEGVALVEAPGSVVAAWPAELVDAGLPAALETFDASGTVDNDATFPEGANFTWTLVDGAVVRLYGIAPQYRAQSDAAFKLFCNALVG